MKPGGSLLGRMANALLRPIGLEVRRRRPSFYFHSLGFQTVLDVGANRGQFAREARKFLPSASIHCFEPLPNACRALRKLALCDDRLFVHETAVGDHEGHIEMYQSAFAPSSSILRMATSHGHLFEGTAKTQPLRVPIASLDKWASPRTLQAPILLKLDVQGYEDRVLRGGSALTERIDAMVVEVSFIELYHGQMLFDDLYTVVRELGFRCAGLQGTVVDRSSGAVLQADAIFLHPRSAEKVLLGFRQ